MTPMNIAAMAESPPGQVSERLGIMREKADALRDSADRLRGRLSRVLISVPDASTLVSPEGMKDLVPMAQEEQGIIQRLDDAFSILAAIHEGLQL